MNNSISSETSVNETLVTEPQIEYGYGWKALSPDGCTYYNGDEYQYILPRPGEKWGPVNVHPDPAQPDGRDCGSGRFHVHNKPTYQYGPSSCWLWYVRYPKSAIVGSSGEKTGVIALQLRRVSRNSFIRMIRLGWLTGANLYGAYLRGANLDRANLTDANLTGAHLTDANLRGADLTRANLTRAYLRGANLDRANLTDAHLYGADLRDANLDRANLHGAFLPDGTRWTPETDMQKWTQS